MNANDLKILLVDDEEDVLEFICYNLRKEGYKVFTANNGNEAIKISADNLPHLIILDIMMPGMDGIETCRELRKIKTLENTIIIFLTARGEEYSQLAGYEAGADDYITKPVKPRILVSKVKALLKRHLETGKKNAILEIGELIINSESYNVTLKGKEIVLPRKEFDLLALLVSKPNKVFTREEIFARIWPSNVIVGDRTIDVHIRKIREKLGLHNIITIKGVGYKFEKK